MSNDLLALSWIAFIVCCAVVFIRKKLDELATGLFGLYPRRKSARKRLKRPPSNLSGIKGRRAALLILLAIVVACVVIGWILHTP